ncbi:UDP-N-acetylmuramoyl-L-alanine--D-glutamate ligase [Teredinibacter turnerae]|uniref:UDP-N-acetylmuramoyl-L-alanine--D-glutamate ligase n=1 Tax=Teredinibacter turnerae TaxID=2426 RepID=UPI0005F8700F|nr:UDP-N-acetylmuramoyl-L-alanine--D-glutamate ligase [Teredinibacter turnerae]
MNGLLASDKYVVIVGLGATGLSVARYLHLRGERFSVVDTREQPPGADELMALDNNVDHHFGAVEQPQIDLLLNATEIVLSPGVDRRTDFIQAALNNKVPVVGDIELFLREVQVPVVGITGSNGKSTVTTLMAAVGAKAGFKTCAAGNIGLPVLDALQENAELYILELSSFQLESVSRPGLTVACMLNVSEDHMDRYNRFVDYCMAKQRIYFGAQNVVYNIDDKLTQPPIVDGVARRGFSLNRPIEEGESAFYFSSDTGNLCAGNDQIVNIDQLKVFGRHNVANVLAVFAMADALNIPRASTCDAVREFSGLDHRCQWVAKKRDVTFINDSKATNVGAAQAAITGLAPSFNRILLIAGGDGKGANFASFGKLVDARVAVLILIGRDADAIADSVAGPTHIVRAQTMTDAVHVAFSSAEAGDLVLLSPACASFDMFAGFVDRGRQFAAAVEGLTE